MIMNDGAAVALERCFFKTIMAFVLQVLIQDIIFVCSKDNSFSGTIDVTDGSIRIKDRGLPEPGMDPCPVRKGGFGEFGREITDRAGRKVYDASGHIGNALAGL